MCEFTFALGAEMMETSVTFSMWGLTRNGLFGPQTTGRKRKYLLRAFRGEDQSWSEGQIIKAALN